MSGNSPGATTWLAEQSALLRGLAHALSNRVGTVVSATSLLTPGGAASPTIVGVLRDEGDRLEALLGLVRVLASTGDPDGEAGEPIHLPDLVMPVVELHSHHPDLCDVPVDVVADPMSPPIRARHAALTRALLVLLSVAKQGAPAGVRLAWTGEGGEVALAVQGSPGSEPVAAAVRELAEMPVESDADGYLIRLPRV